MWSSVLADEKFLHDFFKTNQARLAKNYAVVTAELKKVKIPYYEEGYVVAILSKAV